MAWLEACVDDEDALRLLREIASDAEPAVHRLDLRQVLSCVAQQVASHELCLTLQRPVPLQGELRAKPRATKPLAPSGGRPTTPLRALRSDPPRPPASVPLSFYQVTLIDELEAGIAGVEVEITTPNGTQVLLTDGAGSVRVDEAPPGTGSAHVVSAAQLAEVIVARVEGGKRTSPLPTEADLLVLTPKNCENAVQLPDAQPQRIMIVSRTDIVWGSVVDSWGDLPLLSVESDPCRLAAEALTSLLRLCSTGAGPSALIGQRPSGVDIDRVGIAPAPEATVAPDARLSIDIDALHEALFAADFDTVVALVETAAAGPPLPPPPPDFPTPSQEGIDFALELALLAAQGDVDLPLVPEKQV